MMYVYANLQKCLTDFDEILQMFIDWSNLKDRIVFISISDRKYFT